MATTSYGSPYVSGSDLVAGWPAASLTVANAIDAAGYYIGRGINAQTASATGVLTDAGKTVTMTVATSNTFTVPLNATVAYPTGTRINILNLGAGACTVTATGGVTISGTITALATNKAASVIKTATNTWSYIPFSSGADAAVITSTTGSPTVTTDGTATVYKFTGDGTLVVGTGGVLKALVCGGGGGAGRDIGGGGGGGGNTGTTDLNGTELAVAAGTIQIKVGAGGAGMAGSGSTAGGASYFGSLTAPGGGYGAGRDTGGTYHYTTATSTSGGGGQYTAGTAGGTASLPPLGTNGGTGGAWGGGGGGGAGAAGGSSTTGGNGISTLITGAALGLSGGGGGGSAGTGGSGGGGNAGGAGNGVAGTVNTGGGGGSTLSASGGAGGSGVVIVRVG